MLTLVPEDNGDLETEIFDGVLPYGERVTLYNDNTPLGIAVFGINADEDAVILYRVGIKRELRGRRFGDFFIRAMLYKLSLGGLDIILPEYDERFKKFGFIKRGGGMRVSSGGLCFPSACGGGNHD